MTRERLRLFVGGETHKNRDLSTLDMIPQHFTAYYHHNPHIKNATQLWQRFSGRKKRSFCSVRVTIRRDPGTGIYQNDPTV